MKTFVFQADELAWMDTPIYSQDWRNLCFDKNGKSYIGYSVHPSEEAAKRRMDMIEKGIRENRCSGLVTSQCRIDSNDYSHTIQIPWIKR